MKTDTTTKTQPNAQLGIQRKPAKLSWNKGKLMGQKPPLKLKEAWEIRIRLLGKRIRELVLLVLCEIERYYF